MREFRAALAAVKPAARRLRRWPAAGLTAAAHGATLSSGRDEETVPAVEQRNCTRYRTFLQNFPDTTDDYSHLSRHARI